MKWLKIIFIFSLVILISSTISADTPNRHIEFEGIYWKQEVLEADSIAADRGYTDLQDLYDANMGKIMWNITDKTMIVEELSSTYNVMTGVSVNFVTEQTSVTFEITGKMTASDVASLQSGLRYYVFLENSSGYDLIDSDILIVSTDFITVRRTVANLDAGTTYVLMFGFSDFWDTNNQMKIFIKNFSIIDGANLATPNISFPQEAPITSELIVVDSNYSSLVSTIIIGIVASILILYLFTKINGDRSNKSYMLENQQRNYRNKSTVTGFIVCPSCGTNNSSDSIFCMNCGTAIVPASNRDKYGSK